MQSQSIKKLSMGCVIAIAALLGGCGSEQTTPVASTETARETKNSSLLSPVFRFAKISNGAYFYTASVVEAETINVLYPDFRYEGVAFQQVTSGGAPIYRFANLNNGGYIYVSDEAERAYIQAALPQWRFEGVSFNMPSGGSAVYRLANANNGGYLYTTSAEEYAYAQTLPGWRGEGQKFFAPSALQISGTVSDGVPWAGATVTLKDKNGLTRSGITSTIGTYFIDASGMVPPVMAIATQKVPGPSSDFLLSVRTSLPGNTTTTTMNVTSLTNALTYASASGDTNSKDGVFLWGDTTSWRPQAEMETEYNKVLAALRTILSQQLGQNGLQAVDYDPTKLAFAANQIGQAALLRDVQVSPTGAGIWMTNLRTTDPAAASLYLNQSSLAAPPTLPASTVAAFPRLTIDARITAWKACLAVPAAQRVSVGSNGRATAVHPTCAAVVTPDFLLSGDDFGNTYLSILGDARFDATTEFEGRFRNYVNLDNKQLAGLTLAIGGTQGVNAVVTDTLLFRNGAWEPAGNQRAFSGTITARTTVFDRPAGAATTADIQNASSSLLIFFDARDPSMSNVRAMRVRGPGLSNAGVVLVRSAICSTYDFFTIVNKTGSVQDTAVPPNNILWTSGSSPTFNLARDFRQGTPAWPSTDRNFSDVNNGDAVPSIVAPHSKYIVEVFTFADTSIPSSTFTTTLAGVVSTPYYHKDNGQLVTHTPAMFAKYLTAGGSNAAAQTSVDFEWQYASSIYRPRITTLQAFSNTRNLAITDNTRADYLRRSASYMFERQFVNQTQSTYAKAFGPDDMKNSTLTNATVVSSVNGSTFAPNNNTTCVGTPELRAFTSTVGQGDYREFTFRTATRNGTQSQYVIGAGY